jgi:hypothetical protein
MGSTPLVRTQVLTARIRFCAYEVTEIKKIPWHVPGWPTHLTN